MTTYYHKNRQIFVNTQKVDLFINNINGFSGGKKWYF